MRLISLTANKASFHTVAFRPTGPSIVVGKQKPREQQDETAGQTYNGVGKSLLFYLINYCLGADAREGFDRQMESWEFTLTVSLGERTVPITRRVSDPDHVQFDTESLSLDDFRARMQADLFPGSIGKKFLTFRTLIGLFLRPGKTAYGTYDGIHYSEKPVQKLMRSGYLLGLDIDLILQKYDLREDLKEMTEMSARFAKDPIIKEYFHGRKDVNLDINDLQEQLAVLDRDLAAFKVADNYHDVERETETVKAQLQKIRNQALILEAKIRQVSESLSAKADVSLDMVRAAYSEMRISLPTELLRQLQEVEQFHSDLLRTRQARLKKEKQVLDQRFAGVQTQIHEIGEQLDRNIRFLGDHGALTELLSLTDRRNEVRNHLQKLLDFKELTKKYKDRSRELQVDLKAADVQTARYLDEHQGLIEEAAGLFRELAKRIYPDKKSGLTIENNEGDNQTRFNIDAKILADASDGINEAKIFAYDLMLAFLRRNHKVRFLCHDSRLYSDIDPRQRAEIFRIANDASVKGEFQYIATVNQDQIEVVRPLLGSEAYKSIISDNIVLELNDDTPEDRLLGIEVDLDYD